MVVGDDQPVGGANSLLSEPLFLTGRCPFWPPILPDAEKFHRLNLDEVVAGYALGFNFTTVLREIVIPAGRPGLMQS